MDELISKKDLLKLTGISYGQLYRWKRQKLIPESWFNKQSAFTGQETFFPRKKILNRISTIIELKDQYSLDELAKIVSPEVTRRTFMVQEIESIFTVTSQCYQLYLGMSGEKAFSFSEILLLEAIQMLAKEYQFDEKTIKLFVSSIERWVDPLNEKLNYRLILSFNNDGYSMLLIEQDARVVLDVGSKIIHEMDLEEVSKEIYSKIKLSLGE